MFIMFAYYFLCILDINKTTHRTNVLNPKVKDHSYELISAFCKTTSSSLKGHRYLGSMAPICFAKSIPSGAT
jgi:hypothetical protein